MKKNEIKKYLVEDFIPRLQKEVLNDIYKDVINCILKLLKHYGEFYVHTNIVEFDDKDDDKEESILYTLEELIYRQQIEEGNNICGEYVCGVDRGKFSYIKYAMEEEGLTPEDVYNMCYDDGFQPTYDSITSMWDTYDSTHDVFEAISSGLDYIIFNYENEFIVQEEYQEKIYNRENYNDFIKNFDEILEHINNEYDEEMSILSSLKFIVANFSSNEHNKQLEQIEVLNEIVKIIK